MLMQNRFTLYSGLYVGVGGGDVQHAYSDVYSIVVYTKVFQGQVMHGGQLSNSSIKLVTCISFCVLAFLSFII